MDINKHQLLCNYIDKYQEKLGLGSTSSKQDNVQVERVLGFIHKQKGRTSKDVLVDYESFRKAKVEILTKNLVNSSLRANCERRGLP